MIMLTSPQTQSFSQMMDFDVHIELQQRLRTAIESNWMQNVVLRSHSPELQQAWIFALAHIDDAQAHQTITGIVSNALKGTQEPELILRSDDCEEILFLNNIVRTSIRPLTPKLESIVQLYSHVNFEDKSNEKKLISACRQIFIQLNAFCSSHRSYLTRKILYLTCLKAQEIFPEHLTNPTKSLFFLTGVSLSLYEMSSENKKKNHEFQSKNFKLISKIIQTTVNSPDNIGPNMVRFKPVIESLRDTVNEMIWDLSTQDPKQKKIPYKDVAEAITLMGEVFCSDLKNSDSLSADESARSQSFHREAVISFGKRKLKRKKQIVAALRNDALTDTQFDALNFYDLVGTEIDAWTHEDMIYWLALQNDFDGFIPLFEELKIDGKKFGQLDIKNIEGKSISYGQCLRLNKKRTQLIDALYFWHHKEFDDVRNCLYGTPRAKWTTWDIAVWLYSLNISDQHVNRVIIKRLQGQNLFPLFLKDTPAQKKHVLTALQINTIKEKKKLLHALRDVKFINQQQVTSI